MIASVPNSLKYAVSFDSSQVEFVHCVSQGRRKVDCLCIRESSEIHRESDNEVNGGASVYDKIPTMDMGQSDSLDNLSKTISNVGQREKFIIQAKCWQQIDATEKTCLDVEAAEKHREIRPWREICREVFG